MIARRAQPRSEVNSPVPADKSKRLLHSRPSSATPSRTLKRRKRLRISSRSMASSTGSRRATSAPAARYGDEIIRGIERSRAFILVLSSASNASGFVSREIERAVSKNKPIFTIRVEDVQPAPALELFVSSTQWIDVFKGRLSLQIDRLAQLLGEDEGVAAPSASLAQPPRARDRPLWRSPYVLVGIVGESGPESAFASGRMPFPASSADRGPVTRPPGPWRPASPWSNLT